MFLASDLTNQYNEKHSCKKTFKDWLRNKNTIEYLNYIGSKSARENSPFHSSRDEKWFIL